MKYFLYIGVSVAMAFAARADAAPACALTLSCETYLIATFEIVLGNGARGNGAHCSVAIGDHAIIPEDAEHIGIDHVLVEGTNPPKKITILTQDLVQKINAQIGYMGYTEPLDPAFVGTWNKACG